MLGGNLKKLHPTTCDWLHQVLPAAKAREIHCDPVQFLRAPQALDPGLQLWGVGQILVPAFGDMNVVLNAHTSNCPVPVEDRLVDVFAQLGICEDRVENEIAKVDLSQTSAGSWDKVVNWR